MSTTTGIEQAPPEPRHSAPPIMQQSTAQPVEDVIWDESMMQLDDEAEEVWSVNPAGREVAVVESQPIALGTLEVRPQAIHVRGVDNLSTDDVTRYALSLYPSADFTVEWIDDTSLNLVYESAEIAASALDVLSSEYTEEVSPETLRPAKPLLEDQTIDGLQVRMALMGDKKEKGARDRSRWYLFHPHPSEEYERRRDSRRRGESRYEPYARRRRQRSRSRSPPLNYDDVPRNKGIELFPSKVSNDSRDNGVELDSRSRSLARRRRIEEDHPVFATIVQTVSSSEPPIKSQIEGSSDDLFPSKIRRTQRVTAMDLPFVNTSSTAAISSTSLEERISTGNGASPSDASKQRRDLFPAKASALLQERISGPTLAERIEGENSKGVRELFPELFRSGAGPGRRRRRAEDHF